jgi:hypothetical protein
MILLGGLFVVVGWMWQHIHIIGGMGVGIILLANI